MLFYFVKMVVTVGFLMNGANLYGYIRCKIGAKKKFTTVARNFFTTQFVRSVCNKKLNKNLYYFIHTKV